DRPGRGVAVIAPASPLAAAATLTATLAARRWDTEQRGRPVDEVLAACRDAGMLGLLTPAGYGGSAQGIAPAVEAIRGLAAGCPSTAWVIGLNALHCSMAARLPAGGRDALWADGPGPVVCSALRPRGAAEAAGDGYRLHGHWTWVSAAPFADWALL